MRFNKQELLTLASQPAHKYEKEGVLLLREKSDSFFRRSERRKSTGKRDSFSCVGPSPQALTERWFRLCGNFLFYLRNCDHWSEPLGVIVLENYGVALGTEATSGKVAQHHFCFNIAFHSGGVITLGASTDVERTAWMEALGAASFSAIRARVEVIKAEIQARLSHAYSAETCSRKGSAVSPIKSCGYVADVSESPICEISLSADNLLCDVHGRAPSPKVVVHVRNLNTGSWVKYAVTEIVHRSSNPVFLTTISFRGTDGLTENSEVRFTIQDVRELTTSTVTVVGHLALQLGSLKSIERIRLPISPQTASSHRSSSGSSSSSGTNHHTHPGFLTLLCWNLEREERSSTESTPCRPNPIKYDAHHHNNPRHSHIVLSSSSYSHRRTQSLPPKLGCKLKIPLQNNFGHLFSNPYMATYRFHSGLGGDIFLHEVMAESKLCFSFPQQLLSLWIAEEKELLQEMIGLGELREPWHSRQVQILERHLWLINLYTSARQNLLNHGHHSSGSSDFRQSSAKGDPTHEFVPLNLHLQRIWAQNESLHKSGFHDNLTCGAFTAYAQGYENGGLIKLLQNYKCQGDRSKGGSVGWYSSNKVNMTYDSVQGIKRLRKEIVERMQIIMRLAKERRTTGMHKFVEEIYHRCRLLLSICDQTLIEEAFDFFERQKLSLTPNSCSGYDTLNTETEFDVDSQQEKQGHMVDEGIDTPNSPMRSIVDLFKKRAAENGCKDSEDRTPDSGVGIDEIVKSFLDSPSSNYYRPSEEPEPWDLTQLNIEASVISLNSKVKVLCGQGAEIEHHSLRPSALINRVHSVHGPPGGAPLFRGGEGIQWRKSLREDSSSGNGLKISLPPPAHLNNNNSNTAASTMIYSSSTNTTDWSEELRSSMKKLRLAMDGLLKTSRLAHSIFRLQEDNEKAQLGYIVKYRRDVCFSHALTCLVTGLMGRLWCRKTDPSFLYILTRLGPLVSFHSFLTCFSNEAEMLNDMVVAIEDLKTVEFVLVLSAGREDGQHPTPKVHGSRNGLKVLLPVQEAVFSMLPVDSSRSTSFLVTPVLFNIGINEQATVAERLANMEPQEKGNLDNFARLNEYYRRFKKLTLPVKFTSKRNQVAEPNVDILLDKMHSELLSKKKKNVDVIHFSAQICRALMGLRFTNCKSGKDRTSMSVTLEQAQILSHEYDLAEHEFQLALDAMRSEGCRRENTLKNIGQRKYAFNSLQAFALPKAYRPPPGTFGNVQT
ncbi:inositol polyphosphate-4-phosphatase type I A isoform X2 [Folsomia candida]|uniref:inositol polyphosphate-4-phosphatase type I A isoform X2 n=1 Tax=Folsomia candida TaxID=158441 RepID=UPI001604C135|nr:inositol polyphosphate-4-phosphatase type I A isoform X2 [Folsomia candida]